MNLNKKLSDILDPNKIEVVKNPIEKAHGLPNECYLNNDYLEFEKEKIFKNNWTMIGVASSVPNPGDAKPFNLLGIPILIVRNKENEVKVFHNVCSHRGFKLVDQECKLKNVIRCPYHSWSYDFNGKLTVTPHIGGLGKHEVKGFDKNNSNLKEINSNIWMDLIFININSNAKPFEDFIKPLEDRWSKFISKKDQKLIRHSTDKGYFNMTVNSNWKFAIENYCESYHLPWIHPELNKVSNISDHYHIEDENLNFSGQGSNKYSQQFDGNIKFKCFPNWPTELSEKSEYVSLYPNVMLGIHIDHFYAFWLEPISNNQTKEHFELYYVGDESASSDEFKDIREKNFAFWQEVMNEDVTAIEGMQNGRNSPAYNGGNFSPVMDTPTLMFHKWVATNLTK
ncbi:aromatic ring-hydroxylating oxygenase subunit alpha [Candidatus Pelagibacter sp. FZCC0015]|uniref:aromatic ring-hydroxylating oxygenase subunit alpha n=1 Tax=Candidatus Pelagibacter sp. FZCC0015 TaxID=2268451 RepID=UPI0011A018CB|nr:SRPBCC family protein [Candidatus Pelagibacter sp. FZCC0015]